MLGKERFAGVDIRVRVKGGGHVAQIYGKRLMLALAYSFNPILYHLIVAVCMTDLEEDLTQSLGVLPLYSYPSVHLQSPGRLLSEV